MAAGLSGDYDLVFPLGASELCSFALKLYGLQRTPSFFDEVSDMPLSERTRLLTEALSEAKVSARQMILEMTPQSDFGPLRPRLSRQAGCWQSMSSLQTKRLRQTTS